MNSQTRLRKMLFAVAIGSGCKEHFFVFLVSMPCKTKAFQTEALPAASNMC